MKMDTSRWYELNKQLTIVPTTSKFYKRYLYKITYKLPGIHFVIRSRSREDLDRMIMYYNNDSSKLYSSLYPYSKNIVKTAEIRQDKLYEFSDLYQDKQLALRYRAEGRSVSIFGNDIDQLYDIAKNRLVLNTEGLTSVSLVKNQNEMNLLENDKIIVRTPTSHTHRVYLRQGYYRDVKERMALGRYLENLGDHVKIGKVLLDNLKSANKYFGGNYFHVDDPKIVDMIILICPKIVLSVKEIVVN